MSNIWPELTPIALAALLLMSAGAEARFLETDADRIDPEERYGTETYNDKLSYRYPVAWDVLWAAHDVGFRVNAGSLDIRRFDYLEEWKLDVAPDGPLSMGAKQSRREDTLEARTEREVRLEGQVHGPWRLFALGDGGVDKEYGDIGGGVAYRESRDREVRLSYWSVDHFYETKKVEPDDERMRQPDSTSLHTKWTFGDTRVAFDVENDHPLRWRRPSRGYTYDYARRTLGYRVDQAWDADTVIYATGAHERKRESKDWTTHGKAMQRRTDVVDVGGILKQGATTWNSGVVAVHRQVDYDFVATSLVSEADYVEAAGPDESLRREGALYLTRHAPLRDNVFAQFGVHLNELELDEDGKRRATEVKAQAALDYVFTDAARLLLNTTWDLDQLGKDFPYSERPFRPWGGGNIQILAVF